MLSLLWVLIAQCVPAVESMRHLRFSAPQPSEVECTVEKRYVPSPMELSWIHDIDRVSSLHKGDAEKKQWKHGCVKLEEDADKIRTWMSYWQDREKWTKLADLGEAASKAVKFDKNVFSYFDVVETCNSNPPRSVQQEVPIEPLAGALRHPLFPCRGGLRYTGNKNYMLPLFQHELVPVEQRVSRITRKYFFDLGASTYNSGLGGASQSWFLDTYKSRGIVFDRILAWEGTNIPPENLLKDYPDEVYGKLSYFNVLAVTDPEAPGNPIRILKQIAQEEDLVVMKIDIDNSPVELEFVYQIMKDLQVVNLIDEFYFEHHVSAHPVEYAGWGQDAKIHNISQSYELFSSLRELGIRAHSWV